MSYKVLLVDDERIIVEGISSVVDWAALDTELVATARNGIDAYEKIVELKPDIVISDIKMPGMDGLSLISKAHKKYPSIKFILLSGYSEFEYARTAMHYDVKNYLLKPCNEDKITAALNDTVNELNKKKVQETFINETWEKYQNAQPYIKAHLLTEFLTSKNYLDNDLSFYEQLFDFEINNQQLRIVLFMMEGYFSYEHLFAIKNIGAEILDSVLVTTNIGEYALFLIKDDHDSEKLHQQIKQIRETIYQYFKRDTTVAISEGNYFRNARNLYLEAMECLEHRFYLGEGSIITRKDILPANTTVPNDFIIDEQQLVLKIKSGHIQDVCEGINSFFGKMTDLRLGIDSTKSFCIQLYIAIVQTVDTDRIQGYLMGTSALLEMETVQQMKDYIETTARKMTNEYYNRLKSKQSSVISRVIEILNENLGNPDLSLKMVANDILYMNPDYLGKLFKQETGQRFSTCLTKLRIEKAVEYISKMDDVKVGTLAKIIGFGDNPQYFSQVFKKYTGYTPSEYRKGT
ncbi:response regulator transcription factor [Paenibacillus polymyxa]|uniref:response regulator transcription factor n=1 Tax=Paenibacillus polymyxa TaxID=1406 RepID=UPI00234AFE6C|nr:response regulator [Paenibacillus polymyxa]WCM62939.1 response regulator [Paenibacillus polymyxa]